MSSSFDRRIVVSWLLCAATVLCPATGIAVSAELELTFRISGTLPAAKTIQIFKDIDLFGTNEWSDESLIVDTQSKAVANIVVRVSSPRIKNSVARIPAKEVSWRLDRGRFMPRLLLMNAGDTLVLSNPDTDKVPYNLHMNPVKNDVPKWLIGPHFPLKATLSHVDYPISVECSVHPWIRGWVVAWYPSCAGLSDAVGRVKLSLPPDEYQILIFHERIGNLKHMLINGEDVKLSKGVLNQVLPEGGLRLECAISGDEFGN